MSQRIRAKITAEVLQEYIQNLEKTVKDVLPTHIYNYNERNLNDNPRKKKVLVFDLTMYLLGTSSFMMNPNVFFVFGRSWSNVAPSILNLYRIIQKLAPVS